MQIKQQADFLHSRLLTTGHTHALQRRDGYLENVLLFFKADTDMPTGGSTVMFPVNNLCDRLCSVDYMLNPDELDLWAFQEVI